METSDYISISAAIIALSALCATIWQGWLTRRHNMLSVTPLINIHRSQLDGCFFRLESHGLGPAIIKEFSIIAGNKIFTNITEDPYPEILKNIGVTNADYEFHIPTIGEAYSPSSSLELLKLDFDTEDDFQLNIGNIEEKLKFKIVYTSIYKDNDITYYGNC